MEKVEAYRDRNDRLWSTALTAATSDVVLLCELIAHNRHSLASQHLKSLKEAIDTYLELYNQEIKK